MNQGQRQDKVTFVTPSPIFGNLKGLQPNKPYPHPSQMARCNFAGAGYAPFGGFPPLLPPPIPQMMRYPRMMAPKFVPEDWCRGCRIRRNLKDGCVFHCCKGCGGDDNSGKVEMKSISVRGNSFLVRQSYLAENHTFEKELLKYVSGKEEADISSKLVRELIEYINTERLQTKDVEDLVTLNILASSIGAKSAVGASLARLKKVVGDDNQIGIAKLAEICWTIVQSAEVDGELKKWLKGYLTAWDGEAWYDLMESEEAMWLLEWPAVINALDLLVGSVEEPERKGRAL